MSRHSLNRGFVNRGFRNRKKSRLALTRELVSRDREAMVFASRGMRFSGRTKTTVSKTPVNQYRLTEHMCIYIYIYNICIYIYICIYILREPLMRNG